MERSGTLRHTRHNLVGQYKIVVHKYNQVLPCNVLIVNADINDAYSHSNLYYVWKKTIFILASFRSEMGHTVGEVGHNPGRYGTLVFHRFCHLLHGFDNKFI